MNYIVLIFVFAISHVALSAGSNTNALKINDIPKNILLGDSKALANYLFSDSSIETKLLKSIENGDSKLIDLFPKIIAGTDGAWTEELISALPYALSKNPLRALKAFKESEKKLPNLIQNHCGDTHEDFEEEQAQNKLAKVALMEISSREKSLKGSNDVTLNEIKEQCLGSLKTAKAMWTKLLNNLNSRVQDECKKDNKLWDKVNLKCI